MVLIMGLGTGPIPVGDANHLTAQKRTRFGIGIAFLLYYRQPGSNSKNGVTSQWATIRPNTFKARVWLLNYA
jgi:hypothetical protein